MKLNQLIIVGLATLALSGCRKQTPSNLETTSTSAKANLKFIHVSAYTTNYSTQLKINSSRLSNVLPYNTPFPGGGLGTGGSNVPWYMSLYQGVTMINHTVPKVGTDIDSIQLTTKTINIIADNYYSAFLTDTANKTELVLIQENVIIPSDNTSRFKFVNLMPNVQSMDLYFGTAKVASNIPYKSASPEFILNRNTLGQWAVRPAGAAPSSAATAVYPATGTVAIPNQRIMTVYSRGYSGATANRAPGLSLIYNDK